MALDPFRGQSERLVPSGNLIQKIGREEGEVEETEEEECEVDQRPYMLRNQKYICDMSDGTVLGTIVRGKVTWSGDRR